MSELAKLEELWVPTEVHASFGLHREVRNFNSQPASHHALASSAGPWKVVEWRAAAHSHQVPKLDNQEPRAAGVLGAVGHLDMAQESCISFHMCLAACSRSSDTSQILWFPASFLHSWGRNALANSCSLLTCHRLPITLFWALQRKKTLNGKKSFFKLSETQLHYWKYT